MLGLRLKEERERLGYTQPQLGAIAGTKKGTVINWEKGASSPTGTQFEEMAKLGMDVAYVITGEHNKTALPSELAADEQMLVDTYRALPMAQQKALLASLLMGDAPTPKAKPKAKKPADNKITKSRGMNIIGEQNSISVGGDINN